MRYARQQPTLDRLQAIASRELDHIATKHMRKLAGLWSRTRMELKYAILEAWHRSANARGGKWTLSSFQASGSQNHLRAQVSSCLQQFDALSKNHVKKSLNDIYKESILRHAWILDSVTPGHHTVKIPFHAVLHEAAVNVVSNAAWQERWSAWTDAYQSSLMTNVAMNALNSSDASDAIGEVDATRANTPAYHLFDALSRIYEYEAVSAMGGGENIVAALNADMVEEEIWKVRGDLNVCEDCDANEGLPLDEADGEIPLHPNCHCYPLFVPKSFADLLRGGNEDDRDLAAGALRAGIVPNALIIRGEDGGIAAKAIVDFKKWSSRQGLAIRSR